MVLMFLYVVFDFFKEGGNKNLLFVSVFIFFVYIFYR